tara:strand:+ start:262 stop:558 length:297 start_codon:yes stop_codon:yes gene_type:complete
MGAKTSKIRKSAKGEECTLRLGNCSDSDTVVLAHIGKNKGVGIKCADYMAVYACYSCHDIIDGRTKSSFTYDELNTEKLRALEETLGTLINKGLLNVV